ncbi:MAG: cbb3-type cytochrome c oxidase N-terminal domain-containing protein [Cytophagaceae bacterium]
MNKKISILSLVILSTPTLSMAAGNDELLNYVVYSLLGIALLLLILSYVVLKSFIKALKNDGVNLAPVLSLDSLKDKLTDAVPVEREHEIMTDHLYDDIRELDNNLPAWWVYMFYITIVFSVIYIGYYHFYDGDLQAAEYKKEMKEGEKLKQEYLKASASAVDENNVTLVTEQERLDKGKSLYEQNCGACHGKIGEGGVGPNLTDAYWMHGGGVKNIFKSIKYGIPQKGMISWQAQLSPAQIQDVTSYIISLEGSNPPNAKEPQGEEYKGE